MGDISDIKIMAEPQMDPNVCRFVIDRSVYNGMLTCTTKEMSEGSPLLEDLFGIDGIREIMIADNVITIAKKSETEWQDLGKDIGLKIRNNLNSGGKLIDEDNLNKEQPSNPDLKARVQEILDQEVNPGLESHGGSAEIIDAKGSTVFVTMAGGCQGCASASQTLKYGIEKILRERIPEITEVVDVTNHSAGANPYM
ncbi:MAG: NifU family protein [candidate division Zixibacteria bacterium]|nr:NifU family protein [candidate division Zixibacteria bacterium]